MAYQLHRGDCLDILPTLAENSIDAVICDPPYGLGSEPDMVEVLTHWLNGDDYNHRGNGFMGRAWDSFVPGPAVWKEAYRVLKPGGFALVFGGTRTYDLAVLALRLAGFQIRDCVGFAWIYGSGFPKSLSIDKAIDKAAGAERMAVATRTRSQSRPNSGGVQKGNGTVNGGYNMGYEFQDTAPATSAAQTWHGYGTALKPAWEPIIVAMKPIPSTFAANALEWGVSGLNIDGCRVPTNGKDKDNHLAEWNRRQSQSAKEGRNAMNGGLDTIDLRGYAKNGRWPANVVLDEAAGRLLDEMSGTTSTTGKRTETSQNATVKGTKFGTNNHKSTEYPGDSGGASRFFYCAKSSRRERNQGMPDGRMNKHPTVKPLSLMRYLCRLTRTPTGGTVLDPFMGSGSTGLAAIAEGRDFIGIEQDKDSFETAVWRIEHEYWREDVQHQGVQMEIAI